MDEVQSLLSELAFKQRLLEMIHGIDKIQDSFSDPAQVFQGVADLIRQLTLGDACFLYLVDQATGVLNLQARSFSPEKGEWLDKLLSEDQSNNLVGVDQAIDRQPDPRLLSGLPYGYHGASVPIQLNGERLGLLLVVRQKDPFTNKDIELLKAAEDQIDTLILHELILTHHQKASSELEFKQRELDILTSIDSIRDKEREPGALYSAMVDLLADRLQADLCFLVLTDRETGIDELKALHDNSHRSESFQPVISELMTGKTGWKKSLSAWTIAKEEQAVMQPVDSVDLHLAAVPIVLNNEQLGFFLLIRSTSVFSPNELKLLEIAESQIDSAIVQANLHTRYQQIVTEIEAIYQIDHIRDKDISMDEMLNHVLQVMVERIKSEMGFIALYDRLGERLELKATTQQDLYQSWVSYPKFEQVMNEALEQGALVSYQGLTPAIRSVACLPLFLNEQVIGVLGLVNRLGRQGFSQADQRMLTAIGSQIDTAIYERREIRMLRQVLGRSVDPRVMDRLLKNPSLDVLKPERLELTVLYADIRGSTSLAEQTEPEILVEFIRDYLSQMTEVIFAYDGMVDKFVGDEVMALFGAPIPQEDHALRAIRTGLAMQERHQQLVQTWKKKGLPAPPIGIGIVTGRMIIGEMGGSQRANYTVISREANLGARICSVAEGGQVLISESTYQLVRERVVAVAISGQQFKGVDRLVTVYHVKKVLD